ncbi:lipopolysaccharide biosynthesis protein [Rhizobiales bacterium RZME27]|uniref:Lipopolysaccharide biosynthesis protein n=1 Tax=Endobacterium cereale TaxID=2663029 RepID=A0A6A8A215_9HYPH|nr:GumC family protein [Endobacterium cereale]MEB2844603.1 GumC family protein [Endobacterium cereale]MQY45082.1 lipopolysaccharide biosynthesis protein [Endobacterium cereale]
MSASMDRNEQPSARYREAAIRHVDRHFPREVSRPNDPQPAQIVTLEKVADFLELDLRRLLVWLKDGLKLIVVFMIFGGVLAATYGMMATRRYTVTVDVLIDPANLQVVTNDLYSQPGQIDGQLLTVVNRMRIMTSGNVLARVVETMKLADDQEFYEPPKPGLLSGLTGKQAEAPDAQLVAIKSLQKKVSVTADDRSFVAHLSVSSEVPDKAIAISKAIVQAFQEELARADADGARRAAAALDERLGQLKRDVLAADEKVEAYRRANNLTAGEDGQLVSSLSLTQLNTQLAAARTRVIDAQVSYNALMKVGTDAVGNQLAVPSGLALLLDRASALRQQVEALRMVYGDRHPSIVRMQAELTAMGDQVRSELTRATNAAKSELDKANSALTTLRTQMTELEGSAFNDNQSQVQLRELQRDATSKAAIYESFLSRTRQITEREQINTTNVRVISEALPPSGRSWPPSTTVLFVLGMMAGLVIGTGLAIARGIFLDLRQPSRSLLSY